MKKNHVKAKIYQNHARTAAIQARRWMEWANDPAHHGDDRAYDCAAAEIEQEAAARFSALARAAMGIEEHPDLRLIRAGQIEAFDFAARQFHVYASDNDALHRRYGTRGKALEIANKRTQTFNDAAEDCERVAGELRRDTDC